ncbi:hypothetical protein C0991_000492 [Blastosporella zonata]|nr:hypothetical protein C0991_000492 [Blastosporella zonata]
MQFVQFEAWNGGSSVCNTLQPGLAYCVAATTASVSATGTKPPTTTATPKSVAPGVVAGCTSFFTQTNPSLLCYQIASTYGITVENFEAWNGGANTCNALQPGLAYCVAATTVSVSATATKPPTSTATPKTVAPGVVSGCTSFFTQTNPSLLCYEIASTYGITVENFEAWNGGANTCNALQPGLAYCVAATTVTVSPTATKPPTATATPKTVAPGVVAGCTSFFTQPNPSLLCYEIASTYGITVENFEAWNGGSNVCNALQPGLAYCVAATGTSNPTTTVSTNVVNGTSGCTKYFTETTLMCYEIAASYGITVAQFESWNGASVCDVLVTGHEYCVAGT